MPTCAKGCVFARINMLPMVHRKCEFHFQRNSDSQESNELIFLVNSWKNLRRSSMWCQTRVKTEINRIYLVHAQHFKKLLTDVVLWHFLRSLFSVLPMRLCMVYCFACCSSAVLFLCAVLVSDYAPNFFLKFSECHHILILLHATHMACLY